MLPLGEYSCGHMAGSGEARLDPGLCLSPNLGTCVHYTNCPSACRSPEKLLCVSSVPSHWRFLFTTVLWANTILLDRWREWGSELWHFQGYLVSRYRSSVQVGVLGLQVQRLITSERKINSGIIGQGWQLLLSWSSFSDVAASWVSDGCGPAELQRK